MDTTHRTPEAARRDLLRIAAWVAPVGPLAMAGWSLSVPYDLSDDTATFVSALADETRVQLAFWMMLAFALTIGAGVIVTGLVALSGSPRLGMTGLVLAFLGFSAMAYGGLAYDAIAASALHAGIGVGTIETILAEADSFTAPTVGGMIFIPLSFLGTILLGIALWRGRIVPRWAAATLLVAFPVVLAGGAFLMPLNALGFAMISVGFAAAARVLVGPGHGTAEASPTLAASLAP